MCTANIICSYDKVLVMSSFLNPYWIKHLSNDCKCTWVHYMHLLYAIAITVNCHRKEYMWNSCLTFSALWTKCTELLRFVMFFWDDIIGLVYPANEIISSYLSSRQCVYQTVCQKQSGDIYHWNSVCYEELRRVLKFFIFCYSVHSLVSPLSLIWKCLDPIGHVGSVVIG